MPGRFFDDLLEDSHERMGLDPYEDPNDTDPWKDWQFEFKAEPKKNIGMGVNRTWQTEWANGTKSEEVSTETNLEMECDVTGFETKFEWSQRKMKLEFEKNLYDEDWKAELDVEAEVKQLEKKSEVRGELKIISPDFSGAKLWYNLALINSREGGEQSWDVEKKVNISYENEYHVGCKVQADSKMNVGAGWAQAVWTPKDQEDTAYWLRGDKNQKTVSVGASFPYVWQGIKSQNTWEAQIGTTEDFKGVQGQPVVVRGGYDIELDDRTTHAMHWQLGQNLCLWNINKHKIDKNWEFGFKQRFDSAKLGGSPDGEQPYDIGFSMTYKL